MVIHMEQIDPPTDPLARVVDQARRERGLSWRGLAEEAAIPKTTLNRFARGGRDLTVTELNRIAAVFGTTTSALMAQSEDVAA